MYTKSIIAVLAATIAANVAATPVNFESGGGLIARDSGSHERRFAKNEDAEQHVKDDYHKATNGVKGAAHRTGHKIKHFFSPCASNDPSCVEDTADIHQRSVGSKVKDSAKKKASEKLKSALPPRDATSGPQDCVTCSGPNCSSNSCSPEEYANQLNDVLFIAKKNNLKAGGFGGVLIPDGCYVMANGAASGCGIDASITGSRDCVACSGSTCNTNPCSPEENANQLNEALFIARKAGLKAGAIGGKPIPDNCYVSAQVTPVDCGIGAVQKVMSAAVVVKRENVEQHENGEEYGMDHPRVKTHGACFGCNATETANAPNEEDDTDLVVPRAEDDSLSRAEQDLAVAAAAEKRIQGRAAAEPEEQLDKRGEADLTPEEVEVAVGAAARGEVRR